MITIHGKVINAEPINFTDRSTGEVKKNARMELLHRVRGRHEVQAFSVDASTLSEWQKVVGQDVSFEVSPYLIDGDGGKAIAGLAMADKKALPVVQQRQPQQQLKAA